MTVHQADKAPFAVLVLPMHEEAAATSKNRASLISRIKAAAS